ncbi:ComEC/Rec2 family competence protein [Subtercola sp. RTI3]|uniref:ComEC/Rec2 family competence protein n=1 Tax=Subtercola sp. RTI3 TaxID=3048639 RepID=UPI002B22E838|nr:ComEC/Rec2 family competence protein [Subtercola sp. RTI3]MEA9985343.1 ComEC/Rec2 family competence protein [Subtercola sp. RTI3]
MTARVLPGVAVGEAHAPPPRSPIDLRLILPAASCWLTAGVLVGLSPHWLGAWAPLIAVTLFGFALTLLAFVVFGGFGMHSRFRARRRLLRAAGMGAAVCAAAALACACVGAQVSARSPDDVASLAGHTVTVTLTVGTAAVESEAQGFAGPQSSKRFTATVDEVSAGPSHPTLSGLRMPVLVFLSAPAVGGSAPGSAADSLLDIGTRLRITGTLHPTDPSESVVDLFFADGTPTLVSSAPWMLDWANHLRATFRDSARALPGDGAQLVPGLAIGDVTLVSDELNSAMISSGLSHLTAVSGANCAIVVEAIMLLGGAVGLSRRWRTGLSLAVMGAFVVLVTPSSSVLRAAVMALIVLITLASGRQPKGLPALGLATIVLLSVDPWFSRNYGLALSVLATGGLLVLTRPLQALLACWLPSTLALVIAVPTAAQIACQPVLVLLSPTISTYSVVANLLAEPAAPVATVVGLVSCVFGAALSGLVPAVGVAGA